MMKFVIAFLLFLAVYGVDVQCTGDVYDPASQHTYQFDLSLLHHDASTYIDTFWYRTDKNRVYYVNFCGQSAAGCKSDDTSVCIRTPNGSGWNYTSGGSTTAQTISIAEMPGQSPSSSVTVTYSHGEKCGNGYFTTKIYVNCQETAVPGYFYDADESDPCQTIIYMWSAAGCGKDITSASSASSSYPEPDDCSAIIKDNHRGYFYNLSGLHHDDSYLTDPLWYRTNDGRVFYVNFCGQTASDCDSDTSVCIRVPDGSDFKYVSGGSTSTQVISIAEDPGQTPGTSVTVTYSNGESCGDGNYTTKIYVNCMKTADPGYFYDIKESDPCQSVLYMWSVYGCGKEIYDSSSVASSESSDPEPDFCSAIVKDDVNRRAYFFNLTSLYHDDSWYVDTLWYRTSDNRIYYVNFCGQTASPCDSDTSVCVRVPFGSDYKYINGGSTSTQNISIAEMPGSSPSTSVTVTYTNGDKCGKGTYTTKIYINCEEAAHPGYFYNMEETNECEVTLYMWAAAGCGTKVPYVE